VAEPTGALAKITNCSCQADPFAFADPFAPFAEELHFGRLATGNQSMRIAR
jgi:hypothetical protein